MDLIFKLKRVHPQPEFKGAGFPRDFGLFSKFEIPIKFQGQDGWQSVSYGFILDTGAYISYAPQSLLDILGLEQSFGGLVHGILQENKIKVKIARISFKIIDDQERESKPMNSWFAFYPFDSGPRLLGMKDLLEILGFSKKMNQDQLILSVPD
jgi:hypothetical protein